MKKRAGANSLRGGKNKYSAKTCIGNYVEDRSAVGNPCKISSSFYATTAEGAQDATAYGTQLNAQAKEMPNIISYGGFESKDWVASNTVYGGAEDPEFRSKFKSAETIMSDPKTRAEYRKRWSQEPDEAMRRCRFGTEKIDAQSKSVDARFLPALLRDTPGRPTAVEKTRKMVLALGKSVEELTKALQIFNDDGSGLISQDEIKWGLDDFGVQIDDNYAKQIVVFLDTERAGKVAIDSVVAELR